MSSTDSIMTDAPGDYFVPYGNINSDMHKHNNNKSAYLLLLEFFNYFII